MVAIDLLTPSGLWSMPLGRFGADQEVGGVPTNTARSAAAERTVATASGVPGTRYDQLLVAVGARATPHLPGATTFSGSVDAAPYVGSSTPRRPACARGSSSRSTRRRPGRCRSTSWPCSPRPISRRGARAQLTLVTPEPARSSSSARRGRARREAARRARRDPRVRRRAARRRGGGAAPGRRAVAARGRGRRPALPAGRVVTGLPHDAARVHRGRPARPYRRPRGRARGGRHHDLPFQAGRPRHAAGRRRSRGHPGRARVPDRAPALLALLQGVLYSDGAPAYLRTPLGEGAAGLRRRGPARCGGRRARSPDASSRRT